MSTPVITQAVPPCPVCGTTGNPVVIVEQGIEQRFGMAVLPVENYTQAGCRRCGLLYVNADISQQYLVDLYAHEDVPWQSSYMGEEARQADVAARARDFNRILDFAAQYGDLRGARWLDFGCQTGELGALCRQRFGATMAGVEVSPDYAARADALWQGGGSSVRASVAEFRAEGRVFDVVSALETLEHLVNPWDTVRELYQVTAPGGLLIVAVPSTHYFRLKYHVFRAYWRLFGHGPIRKRAENATSSAYGLCHTHVFNFSPDSLARLVGMGGFTALKVQGTGWSERRAPLEQGARMLAAVTGLQVFPSIVTVARRNDAAR